MQEQNVPGYHLDGPGGNFIQKGNAYLSSDQTGSEAIPNFTGHPPHLPSTDLVIPSEIPRFTTTSRITYINKQNNPIVIRLADGTTIYQTWDEFKRIKNAPEVGKNMNVTMQGKSNLRVPSKIDHIEVKDAR